MVRWSWDPSRLDIWERNLDGWDITGIVMMIVLWAAVVAALVVGIWALILHIQQQKRRAKLLEAGAPAGAPTPPPGPDAPVTPPAARPADSSGDSQLLAILEERYAKGEIDREEFLQRKQDLGLM